MGKFNGIELHSVLISSMAVQAPQWLDKGSAAAEQQLAACRDDRVSHIVTLAPAGHLAANLGDSPPAPLSPLNIHPDRV